MAFKRKRYTSEEARLKMADLCARSEQCEYDISQKLYKYGISAQERVEIIGYLIENKFIDNLRYAKSYAKDKCRFSGWGPFKIRYALSAKRIDSSDISEALEEIEEEQWEEALNKAANSKASKLDLNGENSRDERLKLYRFLLSRGFESEKAKNAVKAMILKQKKEKK